MRMGLPTFKLDLLSLDPDRQQRNQRRPFALCETVTASLEPQLDWNPDCIEGALSHSHLPR